MWILAAKSIKKMESNTDIYCTACFWDIFHLKIHCDLSKVPSGIFVPDISCLPELLNMCRLSSLLQHEIILILFWKITRLISHYISSEKQKRIHNFQCIAFSGVIYYLFQTKCLFSNIHCQSLLQLLLFEIPKGSLGLIFAVRTQIMRR